MKNQEQTIIFSVGVHLQSVECTFDGQKQWRWVAVGFEDESFLNGRLVNPVDYAQRSEDLFEKSNDK